jgi:chitodextrinase
MRRLRALATAATLVVGAAFTMLVTAAPAEAAPVICEKFGATSILSDRYIVMNNVWGADTQQCIDVNQSGGFTVTTAAHNKPTNGAPAAYPAIYAGCHWAATPADCSTGSGLPMQANTSGFGNVRSSVSMSYPSGGTWNAAYDIWFDPTPRTNGQNTGAELMIWLNFQGSIQPIGSQVATVNMLGATWQVWFGNVGWNVISYRRVGGTTSLDFAVDQFYSDAVARGFAQRSWYMTSVQAGFEPWVGGTGLTVNSFTYTTSGGPGDTTAPSVPQNLTASGVTSNSVNLSWSPSTDNVGVAGYTVFRRQGTSGTFTPVGTPTGPSFAATGLSPSTQYQFNVVARDAAGNSSAASGTVTVTTQGGGGGGCSLQVTVSSQWDVGYVINVAVVNSGTAQINGWAVTFSLPSGHQITNRWGAVLTIAGQNVTARNETWNGTIPPGQRAEWGFQAARPAGSGLPTFIGCTAT